MSDLTDRKKIVTDLTKNMLVRASAGSGKTTILVERIVALIESGVPISQIVAITFTKKAANEFYERLYTKLSKRSKPGFKKEADKDEKYSLLDNPNVSQQNYDKTALKDIDNCFLGTIDAFVQKILNEHPIDANIPASSKIIDDSEKRVILIDLYRKIINENLFGLSKEAKLFNAFIGPKDFPKVIDGVLDSRSYKAHPSSLDLGKLEKDFLTEFKTFISEIKILIKEVGTGRISCDEIIKSREATNYLLDHRYIYEHLDNPNYNYARKKYYLSQIGKIEFTDNDGLLTKLKAFCEKSTKNRYRIDNYFITRINEIIYERALPFLLKTSEKISEYFREQGILTYKEAMIHAINLLRKDNEREIDVIRNMQNKYKHYLLDECQDTDLLQYELFFRLTSLTRENDWKQLKPDNGSFFIVGDRKQSIYHFRGADVNAYDLIEDLFKKGVGDIIDLTSNFRSDAKLCHYFNDTFKKFSPELNYLDIPPEPDGCKSHGGLTGAYVYEVDKNEPDAIAKIIKLIHIELDVKYKDFMVLTAYKDRLSNYQSAFNQNDIPYFSEGKIDFTCSDLLIGISSLFKVLANPNDNYQKVILLGSPLFKFDLTKTIDLNFDYSKKLNLSNANNLSPSNLIEVLVSNEKILSRLGYQGFDILVALISLLKEAEMKGKITSLYDAAIFIDELEKDSDVERVSLLGNDIDAVRLANLHKVKGLEAKIVILTKAGKKTTSNPLRHYDIDNNEVYFINFEGEKNAYGIPTLLFGTSQYDSPRKLEEEYIKSEEERLLYVAATRAKDILLINRKATGGNKNPCEGGRWGPLVPSNPQPISTQLSANKKPKDSDTILVDEVVNLKNILIDEKDSLLKTTYTIVNGSTETKVIKQENDIPIDDKSLTTNRDIALLFGTMVHKLLENIVNAKTIQLPESICENIGNDYGASVELINRLKTVYKTIYSNGYSQNNPELSDNIYQFVKEHDCLTETPYSFCENNVLNYGVIDLIVFIDNTIYVIDYKTDSKEIDHSNQLNAYKKVVEKNYPNKLVKTFIYHIR